MAKKAAKLSKKELIEQEVDRRFKKVRTSGDMMEVLRQSMLDMTEGVISLQVMNAISSRSGRILREMRRKMRDYPNDPEVQRFFGEDKK